MKKKDKASAYGSRTRTRIALLSALLCIGLFSALSLILLLVGAFRLPLLYAELLVLLLSLILFFIFLFMGFRYFQTLNELGKGIQRLSEGETVRLHEEGLLSELIGSLNKTSDMLSEQKQSLAKRDDLRMEWIRGVSHDIRTPLSMVIGYAEELEEDAEEGSDEQSAAGYIKESALKISELIDDLNLLSKLEYNRQPLRLSPCYPAGLLRETVADFMNSESFVAAQGAEPISMDGFDIELLLLPEFEKLSIEADCGLLKRVLRNLIGNSIKHNPKGCSIAVFAHCAEGRAIIDISDDGSGIPKRVAECINSYGSELVSEEGERAEEGHTMDEAAEDGSGAPIPHIMGMRIAKRIMLSHGGNMTVKPDLRTISLILPLGR